MIKLEKIQVGNGCYQYTPESINYINTMMQARGLSTVTEAIELIERGEDFAAPEEMIPVPMSSANDSVLHDLAIDSCEVEGELLRNFGS